MNAKTKRPEPTIKRLEELFELDVETGLLRWKEKSHRNSPVEIGRAAGSKTANGYLHVKFDGRFVRIHRIVFAMVNGYWPDLVDHINGVRDDNRPCNLRAATGSENTRNSTLSRKNRSGVKGVCWSKSARKWRVQLIGADGRKYLGSFSELEDAKKIARAFREQHHGEFARHE